MTEDPTRTLTRRKWLGSSACGLAAFGAAPLLTHCGGVESTLGAEGSPLTYLPKRVAGIRIPDSKLACAAAELAFSVSPQNLYNHCIRTYLFAALVFKKSGTRFDEELTFVAAALHDLGLVEEFMSPDEPFEVDGADAAQNFLRDRRVSSKRAEIVWDAIALHMYPKIARRKAPEVAAISIGAGIDASGNGLADLAAGDVAEVIGAYPRLGFKQAAVETIHRYCDTKSPAALFLHPWEPVARRRNPNFPIPYIDQVIQAAPFDD